MSSSVELSCFNKMKTAVENQKKTEEMSNSESTSIELTTFKVKEVVQRAPSPRSPSPVSGNQSFGTDSDSGTEMVTGIGQRHFQTYTSFCSLKKKEFKPDSEYKAYGITDPVRRNIYK